MIEYLVIGAAAVYAIFLAAIISAVAIKKALIKGRLNRLRRNQLELTPQQFFELRQNKTVARLGRADKAYGINFAGVYVLYNITQNMYYVGQGRDVVNRVNNHLTGKGNGDVYADYKYGDAFIIRLIDFNCSGAATLNDLERLVIAAYDAYAAGYNKTRGNS